ncbi:MAG: c-type cytochrome [Pseudomonadota bacterium]
MGWSMIGAQIGRATAFCVALLAAPLAADDGFARLEGHGGPIKGVAVSPDGSQALTASFDYSIGLWDVETGTRQAWLEGHRAAVNAVAFTGDGKVLSAGDDFELILWDLSTGTPVRRFEGHKGKILDIDLSPDGRWAATAGWDGWIGLWDLEGTLPVRWLKGHKSNVNDTVFSADGARLYSASYDGTIRVWDVAEGTSRPLVSHGFGVNHVVLNRSLGWLAYGALDGAIRVLDLDTETEIADLTADRRPVLSLALNPDGTRLAVGDGEGYVMIIDAVTWTIERDFHAATRGPIWALAWTADGARVLSGGIDDAAALWPVAASDEAVAEILATGERSFLRDPAEMTNGERQFARKCSICHTLTPDGARRAGPSLYGIFGRRAGTYAGYRYSPALAQSDIVWDAETIDRLFEEGPDHYTPGSKMPMQVIAGVADRADLIAFLAQNTGPRGGPQQGE